MIGTVLDDRYRIDDLIAMGGQATVASATDLSEGTMVAVKVLSSRPGTTGFDRDLKRFELAGTRHVGHPSVLDPLRFGRSGEHVYIVYPLIEGADLGEFIAFRKGACTPTEVLGVIAPIAEGLDAMHRRGIVHRDVKPDNIRLRNDGRVFLLDTGIASWPDVSLTSTGSTLGSPLWMAPEQFSHPESADARADVYALGMVIYEMLTGRSPRTGDTPEQLETEAQSPVPVPRDAQPQFHDAINMCCQRALAVDPGQRPATCIELLDGLRASIDPVIRCFACGARITEQVRCIGCRRRFRDDHALLRLADGQRYRIPLGTYETGRRQLCPDERRVSRRQLEVDCGASICISDLGSANPTRVDGHPANRTPLTESSRIRLGVLDASFEIPLVVEI